MNSSVETITIKDVEVRAVKVKVLNGSTPVSVEIGAGNNAFIIRINGLSYRAEPTQLQDVLFRQFLRLNVDKPSEVSTRLANDLLRDAGLLGEDGTLDASANSPDTVNASLASNQRNVEPTEEEKARKFNETRWDPTQGPGPNVKSL